MLFDRIADKLIRDAIREGVFDNLPNSGKPLDLEDYFKAPEDVRAAYGLLKSANVMPEEAQMLKEIEELEALATSLASATEPAAREEALRTLQHARLRLAIALERNRQPGRSRR